MVPLRKTQGPAKMPWRLFIVALRLRTHDLSRTVAKLQLTATDEVAHLPVHFLRKDRQEADEYDLRPWPEPSFFERRSPNACTDAWLWRTMRLSSNNLLGMQQFATVRKFALMRLVISSPAGTWNIDLRQTRDPVTTNKIA